MAKVSYAELIDRIVKLCEIAEGTSEIQRMLIARRVLKEAESKD